MKIHNVRKTFLATQFIPPRAESIGVSWEVIKDLKEYCFRIHHRPRVLYVDVAKAIEHSKRYPPPVATNEFLFAGKKGYILIIPLYLAETKEEKQEKLFSENY